MAEKMEISESKHTHNGKMFGIPVQLDMRCEACPQVDCRWYWIPALEVVHLLFAGYCIVMSLIDRDFEPGFPIQVGEEVE